MSLRLLFALAAAALCPLQPAQADSLELKADTTDTLPHRTHFYERGLVGKAYRYLRDANKMPPDQGKDFGIIPGPHYSSTTGLGLGILGTLTYSTHRLDPTTPRSNASVFTDMTTGGFFLIGMRGAHYTKRGKTRTDYKINVSTFKTKYWGIGFEENKQDANETEYTRNRLYGLVRFMWQPARHLYVGPMVQYRWFQAKKRDTEMLHLWHGQAAIVHALTAGISVTYDSRDFMLNATRGCFFQLDQTASPKALATEGFGFGTTETTFSTYKKVWKGGVLAWELHGLFNYGYVPWCMMAGTGTTDRLRGYYEGHYRDQSLIETQLELRQHLRGRNGLAAWIAFGHPFRRFDEMRWQHILPNGGVGYRWEFKNRINIRLDAGITRDGDCGIVFNINEAF